MLDYEHGKGVGSRSRYGISAANEQHREVHCSGACEQVGALFSGLPKVLRDEGIVMVLQAWFDESGKDGQTPVYLLAGYVGKKTMWEHFADDWQAELDREPKLPYLHTKESQLFKGLSYEERTKRLLKFVEIIARHRPLGMTFMLRHSDYQAFYRIVSAHPLITPAERKMMKNPYYYAFVIMLSTMLIRQAKNRKDNGITELIEILLDDGMDRLPRLKIGFRYFIESIKRQNPDFLDLFINKEVETRDDKVFNPLQASDLLAWHLRRLCAEAANGRARQYRDPVWVSLREATEFEDYRYTEKLWLDLLLRMRDETVYVMQTGKLRSQG
jgi:hypothetical protein